MTDPNMFSQTTRAHPAGVCIYCGASNDLSDEHIIPLGLGGNYILPKASCSRCAAITSRFERRVLRGFMLVARTVAALPTRRPKQRPTSLSMKVGSPDALKDVELPVTEFPALLPMPRLAPAGLLCGRPVKTGVDNVGVDTILFGPDPREVAQSLGVKTIQQSMSLEITDFVRLLAKVAYSLAVAQRGLFPRDEVPVLPLILGQADDGSNWVGSADFTTEMEQRGATHVLATYEDQLNTDPPQHLVVARVKLFANFGAMGYEVVVRRRTKW